MLIFSFFKFVGVNYKGIEIIVFPGLKIICKISSRWDKKVGGNFSIQYKCKKNEFYTKNYSTKITSILIKTQFNFRYTSSTTEGNLKFGFYLDRIREGQYARKKKNFEQNSIDDIKKKKKNDHLTESLIAPFSLWTIELVSMS